MKGSSSPITSGIRFGATILAGFVSALVALAVIGAATYWGMKSLVKSSERAVHTQSVTDHLEALHFLVNDAETRERDYLITGDQYNLDVYRTVTAKIDREVHLLGALTHNQEDQQQRLKALVPLIDARLAVLKDSIDVREQMGPESALEMIRSSSRRSLMDDIGRRIGDMIDEEHLSLARRNREETHTAKPALQIVIAGCVAGLVLLLLTVIYVFRGLWAMRARLVGLSQSDTALQTQSRFMDAVFGNMDEGVVVLDRDMKVVHSNPVAEQLLRASRSQAEGLKVELEPSSAGDGLTLALEHLQTALPSTKDPETTDLSISSPEQAARVSIATNVRVLRDENGTLQGGVLLLRDMTAAKRTERQAKANEASLISIFHYGLEAAFITTEEDLVYIGVNEGFLILCDYSRDEIVGRTIEELNFCDHPAELIEALEQARTAKTVCDRLLCFRTRSGNLFEAMLSAMPIEVGEQACILSALHGITWRRVEWETRPQLTVKPISALR